MMFSGFNADYEASSSRCSSASPAGDSLSYYHSPADSFSSMGSPVNAQVRLAMRTGRARPRGYRGGDSGAGRSGRRVRDPFRSGGSLPRLEQPYLGSAGLVRSAGTLVIVGIGSPFPRQAPSELLPARALWLVSDISWGKRIPSKDSLTRAWLLRGGGRKRQSPLPSQPGAGRRGGGGG